jgi:acetolactate synthase-1/2/3 large subunit
VPIHPLRLCKEINDFLTEDTIFVGDGGDIVTMSASVIRTHKPGHWLDPGPLGTLGVGAPFAIAAKAAMPDKEIFVLFGDGAFGLTGFDFDTAIRFDLPFVSVVGNNAGWNQIRFGQLSKHGDKRGDVANKLYATRYDLIVEAMGWLWRTGDRAQGHPPGHGTRPGLGDAVVCQRDSRSGYL